MATATERTSKYPNSQITYVSYDVFRDFKSAISLYEQCLTLNPGQASTFAALGYSHHQLGQVQEALGFYHKAHFINNDDAMTEALVQRALEDIHEFPIDESYFKL